MYPVILRLIQNFFTEKVHGNFHVPCNTETNSENHYRKGLWRFHVSCNIETDSKIFLREGSIEISMYPVTQRLIQKFFTKRAHGNFHVPCNIETNSEILYRKHPWKFSCILSH